MAEKFLDDTVLILFIHGSVQKLLVMRNAVPGDGGRCGPALVKKLRISGPMYDGFLRTVWQVPGA